MIKHIFMAVGLICASAPSTAAARDLQQAVVSHRNFDLNEEADARRLLIEIERTADTLCGRPSDIVHPVQLRWIDTCKAEAVSDAVQRLNAPLVSAAHQADLARSDRSRD